MTLTFDTTAAPEQLMRLVLDGLGRADDPDQPVSGAFTRALYGLIRIEVARRAGRTAGPEETAVFREALAAALAEHPGRFRVFSGWLEDDAESPADGRWYWACLSRSVHQILLDDHSDTPSAALIDAEGLREIDDLLREAAAEVPPLDPGKIPPGLPEQHWWWHAAAGAPEPPYAEY